MTLVTMKRSIKYYSCLQVFLIVFTALSTQQVYAATDTPGGGPAPVQADRVRLTVPFQVTNLREEVEFVTLGCSIGKEYVGGGLNPLRNVNVTTHPQPFPVDQQGRASGTARFTMIASPRHRADTHPKFQFIPTHYRCTLRGKLRTGEGCAVNTQAWPECRNTAGTSHSIIAPLR